MKFGPDLTIFGYLIFLMTYLFVAALVHEKLVEQQLSKSKAILIAACWPGPVLLIIWGVCTLLHI